jgi:hypothetical protein
MAASIVTRIRQTGFRRWMAQPNLSPPHEQPAIFFGLGGGSPTILRETVLIGVECPTILKGLPTSPTEASNHPTLQQGGWEL